MATDLYVSYSKRDDDFDGKLYALVMLFCRQLKRATGEDFSVSLNESKTTSFDRRQAAKEISEAYLFLIIRSPSYYNNDECLFELREIYNKNKGKKQFIAFAVDFMPIETYDINRKLNLEFPTDREDSIKYSLMLDSISKQKIENPNEDSDFSRFANNIKQALKREKPHHGLLTNIHFVDIAIDRIEEDYNSIRDSIPNQERTYPENDPVCVIYTGGTVGMIRKDENKDDSPLVIGEIKRVIDYMPKIRNLPYDIDFYSYEKRLDSSNITSKDWGIFVQIITLLYKRYKGFVILHGSNTMAYTASALSFMLGEELAKPIILTGAEVPLVELHSDAEQNVIRAITAVGSGDADYIKEVCILYGNLLIRGNRATKRHALSTTQGFYSPNYENLGTVEHDKMQLNHRFLRKSEGNPDNIIAIEKLPSSKIHILDVYPDMDLTIFDAINQDKDLDGLILRTYGTGNGPDAKNVNNPEMDFLKKIKKLIEENVIVINLTQCNEGKVELRLFETNAGLFDIGVINGGDMTREAAYCKLKCLLAQKRSLGVEGIKQKMQEDIVGELTYNAYTIKYDSTSATPCKTTLRSQSSNQQINSPDPIFSGDDVDFSKHNISYSLINDAVFRIEGIELMEDSPIPVDTDLSISVYLSPKSSIHLHPNNLICTLRHGFEMDSEGKPIPISINCEVTEKVRKIYTNEFKYPAIKILSNGGHWFSFQSVQLTIFTRVPWAISIRS